MAHVERLPSGKFRVAWREDGHKKSRTFATEGEAAGFAMTPIANPSRYSLIKSVMVSSRAKTTPTVVAFGEGVISDPTLSQNSRDMYGAALRRVAREPLGQMPVGEVKASHVDAFFRTVTKNRANVRSTLSKIFNAALRHGYLTESPMHKAGVRLGRREAKRMRILTADEVERLARACRNERDALAVRLGAYVGLRAGEVGGLHVDDVDADDCRIHVRFNAQRTSTGYEVGPPKTRTSERSLKVPCSLTDELAAYATKNARADGIVFYTSEGNPMTDQTLTAITRRAAKAAGLRLVTFHDLRHTCASLLIAAKMEPKSIQTYLGHSSIRMTFDVYGELFPKHDEPLAETMEALRAAAERRALPAGDGGAA